MRSLRLGTRGSRLALVQTEWVAAQLRARAPDLRVETVTIQTSGDVLTGVALGPEHGSSFFTKEIEDALLAGQIDVAVHSCKDLATRLPAGLTLGALPAREDPRDVLVSRSGVLADLAAGSRVGTSSPRRKGFLRLARPDLVVFDQRGNVPTRVRAVEDGSADAVVLAAAGLHRLGMSARVTQYLDPALVLPAAGQGALALEVRDKDARTRARVAGLDDPVARAEVDAERACLRRLEAGCQAPVGALARASGARLALEVAAVTAAGAVRAHVGGHPRDAERLGEEAAEKLLSRLGVRTLSEAAWAGAPPRRLGSPA